jgi:hypothetical protein
LLLKKKKKKERGMKDSDYIYIAAVLVILHALFRSCTAGSASLPPSQPSASASTSSVAAEPSVSAKVAGFGGYASKAQNRYFLVCDDNGNIERLKMADLLNDIKGVRDKVDNINGWLDRKNHAKLSDHTFHEYVAHAQYDAKRDPHHSGSRLKPIQESLDWAGGQINELKRKVGSLEAQPFIKTGQSLNLSTNDTNTCLIMDHHNKSVGGNWRELLFANKNNHDVKQKQSCVNVKLT